MRPPACRRISFGVSPGPRRDARRRGMPPYDFECRSRRVESRTRAAKAAAAVGEFLNIYHQEGGIR